MRLISNEELASISGGDSGSGFGSGWEVVYQADDSYGSGEEGSGGQRRGGKGSGAPIIITTPKGCEEAYPLPHGKEWQNECKKAVALGDADAGPYPEYNPNWNKKP